MFQQKTIREHFQLSSSVSYLIKTKTLSLCKVSNQFCFRRQTKSSFFKKISQEILLLIANKLKVHPIRKLQLKTYATLFLTVILTNLISLFFLTKISTLCFTTTIGVHFFFYSCTSLKIYFNVLCSKCNPLPVRVFSKS